MRRTTIAALAVSLLGLTGAAVTTQGASAAPDQPTAVSQATSVPWCTPNALRDQIIWPANGGAAGTVYYDLAIRNSGSATCKSYGYPGVSIIRGDGTQVGAAAVRIPSPHAVVYIKPGRWALAQLGVAQAANFPNCLPVRGNLRVFAPDATKSQTIASVPFTGCATGSDHVLTVWPLGHA